MASNAPVRIGIVGAGHRGGSYVDQLLRIPEARLTALCDTSAERLGIFDRRWHLDAVCKTTLLAEMLRGDLCQAVIVTVPDKHHRAVAVECFRAGKDVMLEKPLAPTAEDSRAIVAAHKASGRLFQVGFVLRCVPFYRKIKQIIDAGTLGQVMFVRACEYLSVEHGASFMTRWHRKKENSGSFLLSKCSHDLDILNWLIGSAPTHVASFGGTDYFLPRRAPARYCSQCPQAMTCRYKLDPGWQHITGETLAPGRTDLCVYNDDKDLVDNQVVILQYANNVRATFELQLFYPKESTRFITIGGEKAYLSGCLSDGTITLRHSDDNRVEQIDASASNDSGHGGGDLEFARSFVQAVRTRQPTLAGIEAALACNVIADAVERARMGTCVIPIDPSEYVC